MKLYKEVRKKIKKMGMCELELLKTSMILIGIIIGAFISGFVKQYLRCFVIITVILYGILFYRVFRKKNK